MAVSITLKSQIPYCILKAWYTYSTAKVMPFRNLNNSIALSPIFTKQASSKLSQTMGESLFWLNLRNSINKTASSITSQHLTPLIRIWLLKEGITQQVRKLNPFLRKKIFLHLSGVKLSQQQCSNITQNPKIKLKTPHEIWFWQSFDYLCLQVFGCKACINIPKERCQGIFADTSHTGNWLLAGYPKLEDSHASKLCWVQP